MVDRMVVCRARAEHSLKVTTDIGVSVNDPIVQGSLDRSISLPGSGVGDGYTDAGRNGGEFDLPQVCKQEKLYSERHNLRDGGKDPREPQYRQSRSESN